ADTHHLVVSSGGTTQTVDGYTSGRAVSLSLPVAGCDAAVQVTVVDDDGGQAVRTLSASVGEGTWMAPFRNDGSAYAARAGQTVPVKVRINDCGGAAGGLHPAIRVRQGSGPELVPATTAASQVTGQLSALGNHYQYDLAADLAPGTWTVLVYPYGTGPGMPSMRHLLTVR
ncbi:MAG TPA: hypothetical protein VFS29_06465, partial [Motilibacteraceae bacterium]|nr:hypothetical protein [Motilibacteraceae bacterium]